MGETTTATALAIVIGQNVKNRRTELRWSRKDLLMNLRDAGGKWSRATVGLLESDGVRAERISDLALLCFVLQISLDDLLQGDTTVELRDGNVKDLSWVRGACSGQVSRTFDEAIGTATLRIGANDPDVTADLARKAEMSVSDFEDFLVHISPFFPDPSTPSNPAGLRDFMARVDESMSKETVQAKRGHAARKIIKAARDFASTGNAWTAANVMFPSTAQREDGHGGL